MGGVFAAIACAIVGIFLVLRKQSMLGDGIAHASFGGIALGLMLKINPILTAMAVSLVSVLGISYLRKKGMAPSDSAIAVMMALGFSSGLIIISLTHGFNVELFSYLFGSILTIDKTDLIIVSLLGLSSLLFFGIFHRELLSLTFDEEEARIMGIPTKSLSVAFDLLVAATIVLSIRVIGIILVVALLVLPGISALQLDLSFRKTIVAAALLSVIGTILGILFSSLFDVATSGVIVITLAFFFVLINVYKRLE